ncbi:hypothetical protein [Rhizobium leguminosarum]|uniref:hypothetical protein n=1 Tax=Rhizobium leguminosarum TaxID=384 RepID=UPI00142D5BCB|nr:hypothetical protein [Rhizobium leguminosarum]
MAFSTADIGMPGRRADSADTSPGSLDAAMPWPPAIAQSASAPAPIKKSRFRINLIPIWQAFTEEPNMLRGDGISTHALR